MAPWRVIILVAQKCKWGIFPPVVPVVTTTFCVHGLAKKDWMPQTICGSKATGGITNVSVGTKTGRTRCPAMAKTGAVGNPANSFGTSPPCCVEKVLCKQTRVGKQKRCNARPVQVFVTRDGRSCCLFFVLPTESCTNKNFAKWILSILCFAGCCVPLLVNTVTWIGICPGMKILTTSLRHGRITWTAVCFTQ